ncbi:MAG: ATP-binding protein, partial [Candidatus Omnitrophota bacterium]|nr:ATP-binding protein [Candidatus Omnitrophota bacterium]
PQEGTGLGLSVTRNILHMHSGLIEIESEENKGTKVIITLKIV